MASTEKQKFTSTIEWLKSSIEEFLVANPDIDEKVFGWRAIKEVGLVDRLRGGGDVTTKKLDRIIAFMSNPYQKL